MNLGKTALILIGFQNDYFAKDGILHSVIEESSQVSGVLENTLDLLAKRGKDFGLVISTPIVFTENYEELTNPVGILKTIMEVGAFKQGQVGAEVIPEFSQFDFIKELPGKRGLNAFSNTSLEKTLTEAGIDSIVLAGTVTSICIDSTGRHAADKGFNVTILRDCTSGRAVFEQEFYCDQVFPLYASCVNKDEI